MYIVIVGGGRIGRSLAQTLLSVGHEVLVIDKDQDRCEMVREQMGSVAFEGDGSQVRALREAGIVRADILVATTGSDEDNLAACQLAKELFNVPATMAVVNYPQNEALYELLGVDTAVNATQLVLSTLENEIAGRPLMHLINLRGVDRGVVSIRIPSDAAVIGKPLGQVTLPPNSFITLVVKRDEPFLPDEETMLEGDDEVLVVTTPDEEEMLWEALTEVAS
jgi:trk system potassium uptake protein TrkA